MKILDRTISLQDFQFQLRNLKGLNCVYPDSLVVQYFEASFMKEFEVFLSKFPDDDARVRMYLHANEELLKKIRYFFKILRYSEDQKTPVTSQITNLIREGILENKCDQDILHKETLKTNFIDLIQMELYLRSRYGSQLKTSTRSFQTIRSSIDLFVDSLDKQFLHEYYW